MTNEELQKATIKADMELQKMKDKIHELYEENQQLKKHHICIRPYTNDELREKIDNYKDEIKQLFKTLIDKQKRIDKATEYIKQYNLEGVKLNSDYWYDCLIELLEILGEK